MFKNNIRSAAALAFLSVGLSQATFAQSDYWDVVIIGGGSTGTFSAIRLRQQGLNVAVIEKQTQLGGHVDTYKDPASNATYDYGVQLFTNTSIVTDYFAHFDVPLVSVDLASGMGARPNVNFKTGALLNASDLLSGNATATATGILGYNAELAKHPEIVDEWNITYPVSEDLLMPFGDFLENKGLTGAAFSAFSFAGGCGNILKQTTLYVMKYFTSLQINAVITGGFLANGLQNNQELYDRAQAELAETVFLSTNVTKVIRSAAGVQVHISTADGPKLILAKKLLITIPPKIENLSPFLDMDENEMSIFSQWNNTHYWDMMLKNTGLPSNASLNNLDPDAAMDIPALPAIYNLNAVPSIPGHHAAYYGSVGPMTAEEVKADVTATIERIRAGLGYPTPAENLEFVGFNDHSPFVLTVDNDAIKAGFYTKLLALQGKSNTWWTGAAWLNQASGELWDYTEAKVLPGLAKSLGVSTLEPLSAFKAGSVKNVTRDLGAMNGTMSNVTEIIDGGKTYVAPAEYADPVKAKSIIDAIKGYKFF